tara:strand:+ start:1980 stop:2330 length:351 start_codon:yes stop_codon:yes gene_type:complete
VKLSNNFSREEFKCNCGECEYDTVDSKLVEVLQDIRGKYAASVTVTSGNRCPEYNKEVGGSERSQHMRGRAADIQVKGIAPYEIAQYLNWKYPEELGIGDYKTFTHIDTRNDKARW